MPNPRSILSALAKAIEPMQESKAVGNAALEQAKRLLDQKRLGIWDGKEPYDVWKARREAELQEIPKMATGGKIGLINEALKAAKAALKAEAHTAARGTEAASILTKQAKEVPPPLPRAKPKTKLELSEMAERVAPQLQGEFVRGTKGTTSVAGKSRKQFDLEQKLEHDLRRSREVPEAQPVDLAERKGSVMLSLPGDFTIADQDLYRVGDVNLREPSRQYGGPRFGLGHPEEAGWASGLSAAGKFQRGVTEASQQYGGAPVLANYMMMGPEGVNYALHFADANLKAIDATKMTKKNIRDFNSLIKRGNPKIKFPDFAGIENPDLAYEQMAADPELRKHFNSIMQMPTVAESFKMPAGLNIRHAVTEPELRDLERGMTGYSLMEMEPGVASLNVSKHPTYSHDIPGKFLGKTEVMMPYELTFPDTVAQIRANPKQAPYEFGTLQFGGGRQIIDQQLIDEIGEYRRRIKELTGKKEGGMAKGGQTFPLQFPEEVTDLKPQAKHPLAELAGRGANAVHQFLSAPFGYENPPGEMASSFLGIPDIAKTLERIAYDEPLTSGSGMTTNLLPETGGAALSVFPAAPLVAKGAKAGAKALAPTMADMLEAELRRSGMAMGVAPEGKAAKVKAPANELGFYNPAEKAALNLQRKKGTGDAFISDLKKQPGVTDERLAELGIDQFKGKPNVTREEIIAAAEENRIPLQESVKRERDETRIEELENRYEDLLEQMSEAEASRDRYAMARIDNEMQDNLIEQKALKSVEEAKFSPSDYPDYAMPGGTNYREIRVKLPENPEAKKFATEMFNKYKSPVFRVMMTEEEKAHLDKLNEAFTHSAHHGDEKNVLLHLRVANHADAEGKKGLLIDELQSDWHQQGAKQGYKNDDSIDKKIADLNQKRRQIVMDRADFVNDPNKHEEYVELMREEQKVVNEINSLLKKQKNLVPDAPFKDNWYQLGLKRAIKEAADTGMDRVYLTTGQKQADRYDLSKQISDLEWDSQTGNLKAWDHFGNQVIRKENVAEKDLPDYIGKEATNRLLEKENPTKQLFGEDLKVGGEGMKQWYDKTYKNYLEKYAKQHGSKLGTTTIAEGEPVYYIDITDAMRESAKKGQSYKDGGSVHMADGGVVDLEKLMAQKIGGYADGGVIDLEHMMTKRLMKGFAVGGAVYNTTPDFSDSQQMIPGPAV